MGWEDRPYYREGRGTSGNPLMWLLTGSVPLFTLFGIRVRAHASLIVCAVLILVFGWGFGETPGARVEGLTALFGVILLHEFGHCFGARWTGGSADEIMMTPLGGLAMTMARRRPWPTFVTVAGGPAVNVLICLVCGIVLKVAADIWPWEVFRVSAPMLRNGSLLQFVAFVLWIYDLSLALLLFNILPVYYLDGGQLLQAILWKPMGYYRSMMLTLNVGLVGSVLMIAVGLATYGSILGGLLLILIGVSCLMTCYRTRLMMKQEGPWAFADEDAMDYGSSAFQPYRPERAKRKGRSWWPRRDKAEVSSAKTEAAEQEKIDAILAKVSAQGMNSLTWFEKRTLKQATERQRKRDLGRQQAKKAW